ncbi:MAG: response regulator [Rhodobacteraceae bacterium]|nr:response regulator [Paracoccaceae bacterium]
MTLHVLIVEDDDDFVDELRATIAALPGDSNISIAGSRDQAYEKLGDDFLDLVILDLKIPTVSGGLDADATHGHAVFNRIRTVAPGTPIFVLTGSPAEDFIPALLSNQQQIDIWSEGRTTGTILFLRKFDIDQCPEMLTPVTEAIERLSDVELDRGDMNLSLAEDRLIRIFAKKFQGVRCVVSGLGGGLSGARVIRLRVTDRQGVQVHNAVAKLSTLSDVRRENDCYDYHVTRLAPAATPRKLATLEFGAHKLAGVFFGLADGFDESAFDVAYNAPERSEAVIRSIEDATARWIDGVPETRRTVREIRQHLLTDETLNQIRETFYLGWLAEFESREIQARWACSHGDLHGCNVLVSQAQVALIDYGDVKGGPASLDPVTLELSLLFHPDTPDLADPWPSTDQAKKWGDLDAYLEGCPFPEFVRECRNWALRVAAGNREVAVSAYSYLARQLKYNDTDKDRALALLDGVRLFYDSST